jgi:hypothetical protein
MRAHLCGAIAAVALILAGCGGGSSITPPPPSGKFSDASLKGQYAFLMSGVDLTGGYIARIGTFTADGNGNITGGLEDVLSLSSGQPAAIVSFAGGAYQVLSNGRGLVGLNASGGGTLQLNLVMQSTSGGFLLQTDLAATSSGTFSLQTSSDFTAAALGHPYVFEVSGVSFSGQNAAPIAMIGKVTGDGNGTVTGGLMDTNDGNASAPSGATVIAPGTYALDSSGNGTNFGRGTMTFGGRTFAFYIIDATHFEMLEEDNLGGTSGNAQQQVGTIPTQNGQFKGSFVYLIGGASVLGTQGPVARVARFTTDGNGGLGAVSLDDNNDGRYTHVSQGSNISAASYAMDTANSGSGRGTFTFKDSGSGTYSDVFYMVSPTQAVVQETSKGIIGNGPLYQQAAGPFTVAGSAGNYVSNWSGAQLGSSTAVPFEEDFINQYALSSASTSNISGVIDYVELGLSSKTLYTDVGLGGTLTINKDGTANNLYKFALGGSPSVTVNFQAYFVDANTVLMVCSDNTRTTAGIINPQ